MFVCALIGVYLTLITICQLSKIVMKQYKNTDASALGLIQQKERKFLSSRVYRIDVQKYKKGKAYYLFYTKQISYLPYQQSNVQFQGMGYFSKVLVATSIKYYRDIYTLLISQFDTDQQKQKTVQKINKLLLHLNKAIDLNSPKASKDKNQQQNSTQIFPDQKISQVQQTTRQKQKIKLKPLNISYRQKNKQLLEKKLKQLKNKSGNYSLDQKNNSNQAVNQLSDPEKVYEKIHPSEYKILKLINIDPNNKIQNKNMLMIQSDRTNVDKASSNSGLSKTSTPTLIKDLNKNNLYYRHKHDSPKKQTRANLNKSQQNKLTKLKSAKKQKMQKNGWQICNKIIACIKLLVGLASTTRLVKQDKHEEVQQDYLIGVNQKSKRSIKK